MTAVDPVRAPGRPDTGDWSARLREQAAELSARGTRLRELSAASPAADLRSLALRCDRAAASLRRAADALARHEAALHRPQRPAPISTTRAQEGGPVGA
ncbi:hypothetical protein AB0M28_20505 [Streptomyces sp. NPDC051940]|uniref:hypothetical protein n=1 Tax=Streptomyces sp. NPDC051940 TaxID=3155675 RepID=UPI00341B2454